MIHTADRLKTVEEYYFSKKLREVRGLISEGRPIINMGIGSPDLAPSQEVITCYQGCNDRGWGTSISKLPRSSRTTGGYCRFL